MKPLSRSALVAAVVAASLLATVDPGRAYSGCALSKLGGSGISASDGGPSGFWMASPDTSALGVALGGLGAVAALLTGGTLLVRQRWLAQATALEAEVDLGLTTEAETVLVAEPAEIESEVALAYRR
ncbi:hypothetical protein PGN35_025450 [Nodosilinea sp. PGN35]|uniref:hypothetical protein n=1 Tax=Nodosilinea sp. PGN35 TaxID=3020489 RepID=UPI0023B33BCB|nr:hypothetical protein [Nodosilinea sp. TSF1-S3]MDF0367418.1 hypothetical protein [Nodosilinea sp. TSF1-S3]